MNKTRHIHFMGESDGCCQTHQILQMSYRLCVRGRGWCEMDASIMVIQHCGLISGKDASETNSKCVSFELRTVACPQGGTVSAGWTGGRCVTMCHPVSGVDKGNALAGMHMHTQTHTHHHILLKSALRVTL